MPKYFVTAWGIFYIIWLCLPECSLQMKDDSDINDHGACSTTSDMTANPAYGTTSGLMANISHNTTANP